MTLPREPAIINAALPFAQAQAVMEGTTESIVGNFVTCSWYGTDTHPDRGCYAIVNENAELADLVGDRLRINFGQRSVVVYCFTTIKDINESILLARRPYMALGLLARTPIDVLVEVLTG